MHWWNQDIEKYIAGWDITMKFGWGETFLFFCLRREIPKSLSGCYFTKHVFSTWSSPIDPTAVDPVDFRPIAGWGLGLPDVSPVRPRSQPFLGRRDKRRSIRTCENGWSGRERFFRSCPFRSPPAKRQRRPVPSPPRGKRVRVSPPDDRVCTSAPTATDRATCERRQRSAVFSSLQHVRFIRVCMYMFMYVRACVRFVISCFRPVQPTAFARKVNEARPIDRHRHPTPSRTHRRRRRPCLV